MKFLKKEQGSSLRKSYEKQFPEFDVTQDFLSHGYKELEIPGSF